MAYRRIDIDKTKVSGTLSNFPVLFSGTYSYLKTVANGGSVQNANGYDIIFRDCGGRLVPFEIVKWDATTGQIVAWVSIPLLNTTTDACFYVGYGFSSITTDQSNRTGVWDSNYLSVYHFGDGTSNTLLDSTSNGNNLTNLNSVPFSSSGKISGMASFTRASAHALYGTNTIFNGLEMTIEAWVKVAAYSPTSCQNVAGCLNGVDSSFVDKMLKINYTGFGYPMTYVYRGGEIYAQELVAIGTGAWVHMAGTTSNSTLWTRLYRAGVQRATANSASNTTGYNVPNLYIGGRGRVALGCAYGDYYEGDIAEVRFSNVERSADWILTSYNTQNDPATFYSVGSEISSIPAAIASYTSSTEFINHPLYNDANCVAYYRFESNLNDSKGSRNLTNLGNGTSYAASKYNNGVTASTALSLSYSTNDFGITDSQSITVCGWANITSYAASGDRTLFYKQVGASPIKLRLNYDNTVRRFGLQCGLSTGFCTYYIPTSEFFHWAVVRDNTNSIVHLYINGASCLSIPTGTSAGGSGTNFEIGSETTSNWSGTGYGNGYIDDVIVFSRVLTPIEVASIANRNAIQT